MQTRRKFLRDCSLLAATTALVPAAALAQTPVSPPPPPAWPGFEQFRRQVNTAFVLRTGSQTVELVLAEAAAVPAGTPGAEVPGLENFSLLFHGPAQSPLTQDTYAFEHPNLGRLSIFIVPVGRPRTTQGHYEAIFNRPASAAEFALQISQAPRRR
jgi:hypothetical protein